MCCVCSVVVIQNALHSVYVVGLLVCTGLFSVRCPISLVLVWGSYVHLELNQVWSSQRSLRTPSIANVQKKCPHLVNVIRNQRQLLELTDEQLNLIECFLRPDKMVLRLEPPLPRDANEEILELGQDGQPRLKVKQVSPDQMADPIYALFNPPEGSIDGASACTLGQHVQR